MTKEIAIKLFEQEQLRFVCKVEDEKWYFSIIDINCRYYFHFNRSSCAPRSKKLL